LEKLTGVPLRQLAGHGSNRGPQVSFDRPEISPCLARFQDKANPKYLEALAIIRAGSDRLAKKPEADAPGFQACAMDQWREEKYRARQGREARNRSAIREGQKAYEQDVE
jgi:hypothetical protein